MIGMYPLILVGDARYTISEGVSDKFLINNNKLSFDCHDCLRVEIPCLYPVSPHPGLNMVGVTHVYHSQCHSCE